MVRENGGSFWDNYACSYDVVQLLHPYNELLDEIVRAADLDSNSNILDVSCGSGNLSERIALSGIKGLKIEAFDASPEMLDAARRKLADRPNVKIYRADMNDLFLHADRSFDVVICSNALYAAKDPIALIEEMARVLRKGGRLVIANPRGVSYAALADIFFEHFGGAIERRGLARASIGMLRDLPQFLCLIRRNCEIVRCAKNGTFHFPTALEFERILKQNGCPVSSIGSSYAGTGYLVVAEKVGAARVVPEITVRRAESDAEMEAVYRLRYDVYCEYLRSLPPENYPDRMECDIFDDRAIHFAAYDRGRICGVLRLIPDGARGFLMEENFALPANLIRAKTLEISRVIGRRRFDQRVSLLLLKAARKHSLRHGYDFWIGAWQEDILRSLMASGFGFRTIGMRAEYHNSFVVPAVLDLKSSRAV